MRLADIADILMALAIIYQMLYVINGYLFERLKNESLDGDDRA